MANKSKKISGPHSVPRQPKPRSERERKLLGKDCKDCVNCDDVRGFMCTCHYSYNDEIGHHQVGQDVHRASAGKCEHYTTEKYDRDAVFVL